MKELKNNIKGITLIALVVTIIVLLILAGISIAMLTGQSGILNQARGANERTAHAEVYEALNFKAGEHLMGKSTDERTEEYPNGYPESVIEYFKDKGYIYTKEGIEGYIINIEKLLGGKKTYGNGTDGKTDVYKLEEVIEEGAIGKEKTYKVVYYGEKDKEQLGILKDEDVKKTKDKISFTIDFDGRIQENYSIDEGSTWLEFTNENDDFLIWNGGIGTYIHAGIMDMEGSANHWIIYNDNAPVNPNDRIDAKTYNAIFEPAECVYPNSNILVSKEGETVQAKEIVQGQDIAYYNFETQETEIGKVEKVYIHKKATNFVKYTFEDGSYLEVTDYHPIYTQEGWKSLTRRNGYEKPQIGDKVKTEKGWKSLTNIEEYKGLEDCYDFGIKSKEEKIINNYFANGTLVQSSIN